MSNRLSRAEKGALGKISTLPAHWSFTEDATGHTDANEKPIALVGKRGVICGNPMWDGEKPELKERGKWWVPSTECRKCEFYAKRDKQFSFPRCLWRAKAKSHAEAIVVVMETRAKLLADALRMFGIK